MNLAPQKEASIIDLLISESLLPKDLVLPYFESYALSANKNIHELNRDDIEAVMIELLQNTLLEAKRKYK
jgi:hypothetical protein